MESTAVSDLEFKTISIYIDLDIARAFKLVVPKVGVPAHQKGFELTSLLTFEHFRDPVSEVNYEGDVQRVWEIVDSKAIGFKPEGNSSDSKFLRLQCSVNWYIYRLCQIYASQVNYIKNNLCTYIQIWYSHKPLVVQKLIY